MKVCTCDEAPNAKWGLARLGKFCVERRERSAIDIVLIGQAICLAKERCKKEGKSFTEWKQQYGYSNASASRYMRLCDKCQTEEDFERVKAIGPLEAYIEAGIEAPRERIPRQPRSGKSSAPSKEDPKSFRWARKDSDAQSSAENEAEQSIDLWPTSRCLEEEVRSAVPWQVRQLKDKVTLLLSRDVEELRAAWSEDESVRKKIAADITLVMELLPQLLATMPPTADARSGKKKGQRKPAA